MPSTLSYEWSGRKSVIFRLRKLSTSMLCQQTPRWSRSRLYGERRFDTHLR